MTNEQADSIRRLVRDYKRGGMDDASIRRGAHDLARKPWFNPPHIAPGEVDDIVTDELHAIARANR